MEEKGTNRDRRDGAPRAAPPPPPPSPPRGLQRDDDDDGGGGDDDDDDDDDEPRSTRRARAWLMSGRVRRLGRRGHERHSVRKRSSRPRPPRSSERISPTPRFQYLIALPFD